ncbi:hypothetical protein [Clostridium cellulovorans]|uniref:Uncharacterized protein n=1 Tax=Clostridium cellulovorans (strain ATCC 35296 / DSM 3052 / OCM 3 / 743B) TaxID=573061 RepID=D9SVK2_CLOC7|nr:hypothetical protein [Clostridium cellulovorans]ADL51126.1 hypothetical protein Clocel_1373 [Clostridium cellulovorans 743B]
MNQVSMYTYKKSFKKVIDFVTWILVAITMVTLIFTVLTTYQFVYIRNFNDYHIFQTSLMITMIFSGFSVFDRKDKAMSIFYSICCFAIAIGAFFFRLTTF